MYIRRLCLGIAVLLSVLLSFTASALTDEEIYTASIRQLEEYLSDDDNRIALSPLREKFDSLGYYKDANFFVVYIEILESIDRIDNDDFDEESLNEVYFKIDIMKLNTEFCKWLKHDTSHMIGTVEELEYYSRGRIAEYENDFVTAAEMYRECIAFRDSSDRLSALREKISGMPTPTPTPAPTPVPSPTPRIYKEGEIITFGTYDNEPIEWRILEVRSNNLALVISCYALETACYNDDPVTCSWMSSTLRGFLLDEFINTAFTAEEKERIKKTNNYDTGTDDYVFILSSKEVGQYLTSESDRKVAPLQYKNSKDAYCRWWARTSGHGKYAGFIGDTGRIHTSQTIVTERYGVRPAMWIHLAP